RPSFRTSCKRRILVMSSGGLAASTIRSFPESEPAGRGDGDDRLLIIRRPVRRERLQRWALEIKTLAVASIAAPDNLVDEASIGLERVEIARPVFSSCLPRSSAARISHDRIKVHVFGEPTNECFVGFNLAAHLQERASLHHQTDAVIRTSAV